MWAVIQVNVGILGKGFTPMGAVVSTLTRYPQLGKVTEFFSQLRSFRDSDDQDYVLTDDSELIKQYKEIDCHNRVNL
jgi:hypothetical protein